MSRLMVESPALAGIGSVRLAKDPAAPGLREGVSRRGRSVVIGLAIPSEEASFRSLDRDRAGWDLEKSPPALVAGMARDAGRRHMNSAGPGHDTRGGQPGDPGQNSAMPAIERDAAGSRPSRFRRVFLRKGNSAPRSTTPPSHHDGLALVSMGKTTLFEGIQAAGGPADPCRRRSAPAGRNQSVVQPA